MPLLGIEFSNDDYNSVSIPQVFSTVWLIESILFPQNWMIPYNYLSMLYKHTMNIQHGHLWYLLLKDQRDSKKRLCEWIFADSIDAIPADS